MCQEYIILRRDGFILSKNLKLCKAVSKYIVRLPLWIPSQILHHENQEPLWAQWRFPPFLDTISKFQSDSMFKQSNHRRHCSWSYQDDLINLLFTVLKIHLIQRFANCESPYTEHRHPPSGFPHHLYFSGEVKTKCSREWVVSNTLHVWLSVVGHLGYFYAFQVSSAIRSDKMHHIMHVAMSQYFFYPTTTGLLANSEILTFKMGLAFLVFFVKIGIFDWRMWQGCKLCDWLQAPMG